MIIFLLCSISPLCISWLHRFCILNPRCHFPPRPYNHISDPSHLCLLLSVAKALQASPITNVSLKWPSSIYLSNRSPCETCNLWYPDLLAHQTPDSAPFWGLKSSLCVAFYFQKKHKTTAGPSRVRKSTQKLFLGWLERTSNSQLYNMSKFFL